MASQTILFTVMPRGISLNPDTLPVSVYVSPRLFGATKLGAFPDWLQWTQRLKESGLSLTFHCGAQSFTAEISTEPLRPELWAAMFKEDTLVRSHTFDDYSDRAIFSYPVRLALSALKSVYQQAGVLLALPDRNEGDPRERRPYLNLLKNLIGGLQVNWTDESGERLRKTLRDLYRRVPSGAFALQFQASELGPDGLLKNLPAPGTLEAQNFHQAVARQFAVFHHVPPGKPIAENPPDFDKLLDFHQALSALNSYPELMRALGLVFDVDLPHEFVAITQLNQFGTLSVTEAVPGQQWSVETAVPSLATAYLHSALGHDTRIFLTAPGFVAKLTPDLETLGLLHLDPARFGLAQVDVDGGMHKAIMLAETIQDEQPGPASPDHPEVFDTTATLPSLRSGGLSLFADARAAKLLNTFKQSKTFNDALGGNQPQPRPFYAEDLIHGYRLDIWDSHTNQWHSLHRRNGLYTIEEEVFETTDEEGFVQLAATQAAPNPDTPPANDLYLHEAITRWPGWSLSAPWPGKHLTRDGDPAKALPDGSDPENVPATPFKMTTSYKAFPSSLPCLRFGRRYRLRARVVDLCGNSLKLGEALTDSLSAAFGLPLDAEGFAYLRYEPVVAPQVVLRDTRGVTDPGSAVDRLVIRTFNSDPSQDTRPADRTVGDRHILPPRTSVEIGERLGMFDDPAGNLVGSQAMYDLISARDAGELNQTEVEVAGQMQKFPLEPGDRVDTLPYLPDVLSRGAALRDLPGTPDGSIGAVAPGGDPEAEVAYTALSDPNPRPGSATLVSFGGGGDWQQLRPFRLALDEGDGPPQWDADNRVLTVFQPKGTIKVVPLTSHLTPDDLKLMGVWQWLREHIEDITASAPEAQFLHPGQGVDRIAHVLQVAVEGGHWMLTPPRLLKLVHAVQQPLRLPAFTPLTVQHEPYDERQPDPKVVQTEPESRPTAETELSPITAWRRPGAIDAYLIGGLQVHGASTAKVDILAEWTDPVDDLNETVPGSENHAAQADEIPLNRLREGPIFVNPDFRRVAHYDPEHDLLCFARSGDKLGNLPSGEPIYADAAPRHHFNDTKHHRVRYTARATSRYRDYFPQDQDLDFTRTSLPVEVDVPASARPVAPQIAYVIPTFGWQRQTETNLKRSVRFGGGLRVYLERPWFSSGEGELLGVALYSAENGVLDRDQWKSFITQWGVDPIWQTVGLPSVPDTSNFPEAVEDFSLSLEERAPGRVHVAGVPVAFDEECGKWYGDLTVNTETLTYAPFIRLALMRYQPHALPDAKLSRVVLADFAQLTPERSAVVTADPYHPRRLRVTISGAAPQGPAPGAANPPPNDRVTTPTHVELTVQQRDAGAVSELDWKEAAAATASIIERHAPGQPALILWAGTVEFAQTPAAGSFRLLIREYEYVSANYTTVEARRPGGRPVRHQPKRLIYAETIAIDSALVGPPSHTTGTVISED